MASAIRFGSSRSASVRLFLSLITHARKIKWRLECPKRARARAIHKVYNENYTTLQLQRYNYNSTALLDCVPKLFSAILKKILSCESIAHVNHKFSVNSLSNGTFWSTILASWNIYHSRSSLTRKEMRNIKQAAAITSALQTVDDVSRHIVWQAQHGCMHILKA